MAHNTLLFLKSTPRHMASAIRTVLAEEEYEPVATAKESLKLLKADPSKVRLFVISKERDWIVVGLYASHFDFELAAALASAAGNEGYIVQKSSSSNRGKSKIWSIKNGQASDEPEELSVAKTEARLTDQGIDKRLQTLKVKDHLAQEHFVEGVHEDIVLGFSLSVEELSEVEQALGESSEIKPKDSQHYSLDEFLEHAIGHKKVRAIAKAQLLEQLKNDGFNKTLEIINPEPQGHYCEAFEAESYSFTSNGSYVWFEWFCEEACEPRLSEEFAFPSCDLKFRFEKAADV